MHYERYLCNANPLPLGGQRVALAPVLATQTGVFDAGDNEVVFLVAFFDDRRRATGLELFGIKTGKFFIVGTLKGEPKK